MPLRRLSLRIVGTSFLIIGCSAVFLFPLWQSQLIGLSTDGEVTPFSWLILRILLVSLLAPGILLVAGKRSISAIRKIDRFVNSFSPGAFLVIVLSIACGLRLFTVFVLPIHVYEDWTDYHVLAANWAETGEFRETTHMTTFRPPGWPFLLSRLYLVFGADPLVGVIFNMILGVVLVFLTYRYIKIVWSEAAARYAAIFIAVLPSYVLFTNYLCTEILFTAALILTLIALNTVFGPGRRTVRISILSGVLLGMTALIRPAAAALLPAIFVLLLFHRSRLRQRLFATLALGVGFALVVAPWIIRNHALSDRATIATNGGVNFYIGNYAEGRYIYSTPDTTTIIHARSPFDEAYNDRKGYRLGLQFIRENPGTFLSRGVLKILYMMGQDMQGVHYDLALYADGGPGRWAAWLALLSQLIYNLLLVLAIGGVFVLFSRFLETSRRQFLALMVIVSWLVVHFVFFGEPRFHFPLVPLLAGFAGLAITEMTRRAANCHSRNRV